MDTVFSLLCWLSRPAILGPVTTAHTRRSRGRPAVPLDRIIDMALQIVDEQGADALSMRTLAQRLESGTATLYRHFANRSEVIAQVLDRVFGEVEFSADELAAQGWRQACASFARAMFEAFRRHPNVMPLLSEQPPIGPNAIAQRERLLAVLLDNGFTPQLAARAYATVARYVLGFALQLAGHEFDDAKLAGHFHTLDPRAFPATLTVADHLPVPLDEEFALGLELIVDGLARMRRRARR
ncbi:TetR/AcrR family transcriptional regulator [Mycobacterium heckeshornense]|uniref:Putative transcriptional regulator, TetR family protein n=2 Tax=Mycobacterium heckeshornense TaxID=110505 RepID=A0A2G8B616_9MYCO|nr:TetR/AcrR family transcriptional regulator [Mycobacterium heckeshornense]PIJ33174.1 TetR/AcrR family transcriptional regulator [Mycobacterium heckeshornense]BCO37157.1 putative transcriptional regulator, TetR family protein [Mycobacterium heckeshornense]BCQ10037.1 TetR family transcriptional regulator [Mycobacterium heckeshornense]